MFGWYVQLLRIGWVNYNNGLKFSALGPNRESLFLAGFPCRTPPEVIGSIELFWPYAK